MANHGKAVFVHMSAVERAGLSTLNEGAVIGAGEYEYRLKSINEPHERVVRESDLEKS
jgi:hypothetical protein